jgi:hypothetical protein
MQDVSTYLQRSKLVERIKDLSKGGFFNSSNCEGDAFLCNHCWSFL